MYCETTPRKESWNMCTISEKLQSSNTINTKDYIMTVSDKINEMFSAQEITLPTLDVYGVDNLINDHIPKMDQAELLKAVKSIGADKKALNLLPQTHRDALVQAIQKRQKKIDSSKKQASAILKAFSK